MSTKNVIPEDFDWDLYENGYTGTNLRPNTKVKTGDKRTIVYSHEKYAEEAFKHYAKNTVNLCPKDEIVGSIMPIVNIHVGSGNTLLVDTAGHATMRIDMNKERELAKAYGYASTAEFIEAINNPVNKKIFLDTKPVVKVVSKERSSMWEGHLSLLEREFEKQLTHPTHAYIAKLLSCNNGGYICDVNGIKCFMPGSMAAPGIIEDFQALIGKEIPVMVINHVDHYGFVVSYKRYLQEILPTLVQQQLEINQLQVCKITGLSHNGIFVSFNDKHNEPVFSGLIHRNEMSLDFEKEFDNGTYKEGDVLIAYIHTITNENGKIRIILGDCDMTSHEYAVRAWANEEQEKYNAQQKATFVKVGAPSAQKKTFTVKRRRTPDTKSED